MCRESILSGQLVQTRDGAKREHPKKNHFWGLCPPWGTKLEMVLFCQVRSPESELLGQLVQTWDGAKADQLFFVFINTDTRVRKVTHHCFSGVTPYFSWKKNEILFFPPRFIRICSNFNITSFKILVLEAYRKNTVPIWNYKNMVFRRYAIYLWGKKMKFYFLLSRFIRICSNFNVCFIKPLILEAYLKIMILFSNYVYINIYIYI